jgi:hypothetical protein
MRSIPTSGLLIQISRMKKGRVNAADVVTREIRRRRRAVFFHMFGAQTLTTHRKLVRWGATRDAMMNEERHGVQLCNDAAGNGWRHEAPQTARSSLLIRCHQNVSAGPLLSATAARSNSSFCGPHGGQPPPALGHRTEGRVTQNTRTSVTEVHRACVQICFLTGGGDCLSGLDRMASAISDTSVGYACNCMAYQERTRV